MIDTLLADPDPNWRTKRSLRQIWESFGNALESVVAEDVKRWESSVRLAPDSLADLPAVGKLVEAFGGDVRLTADEYLRGNLALVRKQQTELGLLTYEEDDFKPKPMTDDVAERMKNMRKAAASLQKLQKAQEAARDTYVGWDMMTVSGFMSPLGPSAVPVEAKFNPERKPQTEQTPALAQATHVHVPYDNLKARYDAATKEIEQLLTTFPELYAVSREGSSDLTGQFVKLDNPEKARAALGRALDRLVNDIKDTQKKLKDGPLDPLDLTPIHGRLAGGEKVGGVTHDWKSPLAAFAAKRAAKDHELDKALKALAFDVATQAMFLLAPFTGGASLFVSLAALGAQAAKTADSQQNYEALATAAKTSVKPGTQLVTADAVAQAEAAVRAEEVALALAAICVGADVVSGAIKGVGVPGEAPAADAAASGETRSVTATSSPPSPPIKLAADEPMQLESAAETTARLQEQIGPRPDAIDPPPAPKDPMLIEPNKAPAGGGSQVESQIELEPPLETAKRLGEGWTPPSGKRKVIGVKLRRRRLDPRWKLTREDEMTFVTFDARSEPLVKGQGGRPDVKAPQSGVPYRVRADWLSYYRWEPPRGGGVVEIGPRRYVYDAAGNPIEASTTDMTLGVRERGQYAGGGPDYRPGDDYGHLLGVDFGHVDAQLGRAGGGPQASGVNRVGAGGGGDWYLAEREAARQAWVLKANGQPMRVVAQARNFQGARAGETRIYVESDGRIAYDSGWIPNP
jgi:hypothetical protein